MLLNNNRKIVIHHTHLISNIIDYLKTGDLLFFDDCVYSQYKFIKNNIDKLKNMTCILCHSKNIYRPENNKPIENITTDELHKMYHNGDKESLNGFMSLSEIDELLNYDNVYRACHGYNHLELFNLKNEFTELKMFIDDINMINHEDEIFVYPYDYIVPHSENILRKCGYKYIFPICSSRIYIEKFT